MKIARRFRLWLAALVLATIHLVAAMAGFFSPYDPTEQNRAYPFAPPMRVHFYDARGNFHWRPFVFGLRTEGEAYRDATDRMYSVRFFEKGRLFRVDEPGRLFLLGADAFGRDQFSRILYGGRVSLGAGLLATVLTILAGLVLGSLAGFYAGWWDTILMRLAEVFLALPWLYLLLGVRAFLPLSLDPVRTFLLMITVIGAVGWARPARLFRGIVLSAREREYVYAARGFGASDRHIFAWHILPELHSAVLTQATLLIPQYILAEVTLSFLGLGVGEPAPSWGGMLVPLRDPGMLTFYWWLAIPALVLLPVVLCYNALAGTMRQPT